MMALLTIPAIINNNADFLKQEGRVNGLWNNLITSQFPLNGPQYHSLVCAEPYPKYNDTQDLQADLTVASISVVNGNWTSKTVLAYEGKGSTGQDSIIVAREQLEKWMFKAELATPSGKRCWAICAKGEECRFWIYKRNEGNLPVHRMIPIELAAGNVIIAKKPKDWSVNPNPEISRLYKLTNANDYAVVRNLIAAIANTPLEDIDEMVI